MAELILGIESSCDETAAALVFEDLRVASTVVSSQADIHARYGGVVPELASRVHIAEIVPTISRAFEEAGRTREDVAAIAVTAGPGLMGSLLVGISAAKALAWAWNKPLLGINHLEGHLASASMAADTVEYPCLVLLASGGHTLLARLQSQTQLDVLGTTRDDSAGEAYDKVAKMLGLGYPGGPVIDRLARDGSDVLNFPRPMRGSGLEFSFSGLKTAVRTYLTQQSRVDVKDIAASFAAAVMDVLVEKLDAALAAGEFKSFAVVGGVAASPLLRGRLAQLSERRDLKLLLPPVALATDNAAMIAAAAWPHFRAGERAPLNMGANPGWRLPQLIA
jgi:N6-L-threonylcarbamoyladenine synthase